jgi:glutaminyl-peptide cyclotransferase
MTRAVLGAAVCAALVGCGAAADMAATDTQTTAATQASPSGFDSSRAWEHLRQMVSIGPRPAGSAAIRQTRAYITRQLASMGLTVMEQPFVGQTPLGPVSMVNLIVQLPGRRTDKILFTGHYDTKLFRDQVFVGASDGASSAAFLIELARVLKSQSHEFTYEFVWFDGEEAVVEWQGLDHTYGSRYYVQAAKAAKALSSIKAMILVDMIGDRDLTIRREQQSTTWLKDIIWGAAKRLGHGREFLDEETTIEDDHVPFLEAGVPSVDIIDLDYPAWHNTNGTDTLDKVSARSLQIVGDVLIAALPDIEKRLVR